MRSIHCAQRALVSLVFLFIGFQEPSFAGESYRVGPHDVLGIDVFGEQELTKKVEVDGQGKVKYPLLGDIYVKGMTVEEVQESLTSGLQEGYLKNPKVAVYIEKYRNFYVHGEAIRPGAYSYQTGLTVLKAVALAGGFTEKADKKHIKVIRMIDEKEKWIKAGIEDIIQPDDVLIIFDETNFALDGPF